MRSRRQCDSKPEDPEEDHLAASQPPAKCAGSNNRDRAEEHLSRSILETIARVGQFDETPGAGIAFQVDVEDAVGVSHQINARRLAADRRFASKMIRENLTADPEQDYFAGGFTEDLITETPQTAEYASDGDSDAEAKTAAKPKTKTKSAAKTKTKTAAKKADTKTSEEKSE